VAKLYGYWIIVNYREAYNIFACNGILFNHESPRRGETFVTRKISRAAARIKYGIQDKLRLGNLDAKRDWGYAPEFVEGMWKILQQEKADDFVLATGETHTVREFVDLAFRELGMELQWEGKGQSEKGLIQRDLKPKLKESTSLKAGTPVVEIDPHYFRPTEVDILIGDYSKAKNKLGWQPKIKFEELVRLMAKADWAKVQKRGF